MDAKKPRNVIWLKKLLIAVFVLFTSMMVLSVDVKATEDDSTTLTIIHTNDIHAQIDNFAKLAAYNETQRNLTDLFLYLDAGDIFSGNPVVDLMDGEPIIELFNAVGLDALAIGNHEFDYGVDALNKSIANSNAPWLSANTEVIDSPATQPEPYHIFEEAGLKIGVLSLTQAPPATAPKNIKGIEFHPYAETVEQYTHLRDEVDVLIGLNHIGLGDDRALAEEFDIFDVIIGGHSHTTLKTEQVVNGTPIVQTGSHLNNIGKVNFEVNNDTKEVVFTDYTLQSVEELEEEDPDVKEIIDYYNEEMEEILDEVIGETTGMSRDNRYAQDAPLGNFWTDAMRHFVGADMAFTNNGGIRASIEPGELTVGDIYSIEPFANQVMEIDMTGEAIKNVIEFSYIRNDRNQIDLQTSGLHYKFFTDGAGNLVDVELTFKGEPLDMDRIYKVAVPDYIGSGGSGYDFAGDVITNNAGLMTETMIEYAEYLMDTEGIIDYKSEGRIEINKVGKGFITVGEAIESNEGEALVVGYIVGHVQSVGNYNFEAPFGNDWNFLLADDPNETDPDKMLPVQISAEFRDAFGLETNPDLIGTQVVVHGDLEDYYSVPGLKSPKSMNIYEVTPIVDVRQQELGTEWIIEGTVLVDSGAWGGNSFYIHDGTGGILVFQYDYEVEAGDYIRLTGTLGEFNGEIQFDQVSNIEVLERNQPLPTPIDIMIEDVGEQLLGELVSLKGATITAIEEFDFGTFEFLAEIDGESVLIRVDNRTGLSIDNFMFDEGDVVDITGLVGVFQGEYQIKPRSEADIVAHDGDDDNGEGEDPGDEDEGKPGAGDEDRGSDDEDKLDDTGTPGSDDDGKAADGIKEDDGAKLPKTATMMWNWLLGGLMLLVIGSGTLVYTKMRKIVVE